MVAISDTASKGGLRVGLVEWEQFGPFDKAALDFSMIGVTAIEGSIANVRGCDSNGAGKSFLIDGILWCCYDRCARPDYAGDDVIRIGSTGGCRVTVNIVGGPHPIRFRRHRKWTGLLEDGKTKGADRVQVWVGGKEVTRGNNPMTNAYIEELLGMDFSTAVNVVAFGSREDVKGFFSANDADRKAVLETMLGLGLYSLGEEEARKRMKVGVTKLSALDGEITELLRKAKDWRESADKFSGTDELNDAELAMQTLRVKANKAAQTKDKAEKAVADQAKVAQKHQMLYDTASQIFETKLNAYQVKIDSLRAVQRKHEKEAATAEGQCKILLGAKTKLLGLKGTCPTCQQAVAAQHVEKIAKGIAAQVSKLSHEAETCSMEATVQAKEITSLLPPAPPPAAALSEAETKLTELKGALKFATAMAVEAEKTAAQAESDYATHASKLEQLNKSALDAETAAAEKQVERQGWDTITARQEFWAAGFGTQGLRSFLLEAEMPWINNRATAYARKLLGDGAVVRLTATTVLKSKDAVREKMTVEGSVAGMTKSFRGASKGQKHRMDLSLLLAFRDLTAKRVGNPFDQLFADEVFDGMDKTGTESVAAMLAELAVDKPVILVTHDDRLKSIGDRTVIVHHDGNPEGGKATLEVSGESAMISPVQTKKAVLLKTAVKKKG